MCMHAHSPEYPFSNSINIYCTAFTFDLLLFTNVAITLIVLYLISQLNTVISTIMHYSQEQYDFEYNREVCLCFSSFLYRD